MFGGYDQDQDGGFPTRGFGGFGFGLNFGGLPSIISCFEESYRAFPVEELSGPSRLNVQYGGKIFLPPSALVKLSNLNISYPMLFELTFNDNISHAGVLEFIAEEGRVYLPNWMMASLEVSRGDIIEVVSTTLPLGTFVKIQPQSTDFLDITDPKAVLENAFRNFSCLGKDEIITISYNNCQYDILVMEIKPEGQAISIIETDLEVDFAAPLGYVEPPRPSSSASAIPSTAKIEQLEQTTESGWKVFSGDGQRLSSRSSRPAASSSSQPDSELETVARPDSQAPVPLKLPFGNLFFGYRYIPPPGQTPKNEEDIGSSTKFSGEGQQLRPRRGL